MKQIFNYRSLKFLHISFLSRKIHHLNKNALKYDIFKYVLLTVGQVHVQEPDSQFVYWACFFAVFE